MDRYKDRIATVKTMQLATCSEHGPWICTVYFVLYDNKLYWLSEPHRRHTAELINDPRAAVAIVVKSDVPVIGVQLEGEVVRITDSFEVKAVMELYVEKYGVGKGFHERFTAGTNKHQLFCFTPRRTQIFDET
jgi:uncharacterized protein YhbP (UPF0306 family)